MCRDPAPVPKSAAEVGTVVSGCWTNVSSNLECSSGTPFGPTQRPIPILCNMFERVSKIDRNVVKDSTTKLAYPSRHDFAKATSIAQGSLGNLGTLFKVMFKDFGDLGLRGRARKIHQEIAEVDAVQDGQVSSQSCTWDHLEARRTKLYFGSVIRANFSSNLSP